MKHMYLEANVLGQTYLHFAAAQNYIATFEEFFNGVMLGKFDIRELRRIDNNGYDPLAIAAIGGSDRIIDLTISKLTSVFTGAMNDIAKAPIAKDGKTIKQIVFEEMTAENVALSKFGMTAENLSRASSGLVKLDLRLSAMLACAQSPISTASSLAASHSTAISTTIAAGNGSNEIIANVARALAASYIALRRANSSRSLF